MTELPPSGEDSARDPDDGAGSDLAPRLLDDRSRPGFRELFGRLARRATGIDVALTHLRLSTLDLSERELRHVERIRLLLAEVSAVSLDAEAHAMLHRGPMAANLRRLATLLSLARIEVRSAPLGGWAPDFSVFRNQEGPCAVLIGPHRFDRGMLHEGPVLASLHGAEEAVRVATRFAEIWSRGHDIRPAIAGILGRAEQRAPTPNPTTISRRARARDSVDTPHPRG
jgi:hypothetical protein